MVKSGFDYTLGMTWICIKGVPLVKLVLCMNNSEKCWMTGRDQWYCLWLRALVKSEKNSFSRNQVNDLDFISAPSFPNILLSTFIKFVSRLVLFYFVDLFFIFFSLLDFHAALSQNPFLGLYCS